jgi:hypothetical protein
VPFIDPTRMLCLPPWKPSGISCTVATSAALAIGQGAPALRSRRRAHPNQGLSEWFSDAKGLLAGSGSPKCSILKWEAASRFWNVCAVWRLTTCSCRGENMNYIRTDKPFGEKTREEIRCIKCYAQPDLVRRILDPVTGNTVRIFECKCGIRTWAE